MLSPAPAAAPAWPEAIWDGTVEAAICVLGSDEIVALPVERWHGPVLAEEATILARAESPVLDVGCGPGRHAAALRSFGHDALGIDSSAAAVRAARRRGADALHVSVFGPVPDPGRWATALLLDGNIGIGGDPVTLLARIHRLLRPEGRVFVEVEGPEMASRRFQARVRHAGGAGRRFPWASVGAADIASVAARSGFVTDDVWCEQGRWFAELRRSEP